MSWGRKKNKRTVTLYQKILLGITFLSVLITILFSTFFYMARRDSLLKNIDDKLVTAATLAHFIIPLDYHDRIKDARSVSAAEYTSIVSRYNKICRDLGLEYLWSLMLIDKKIIFTTATSPDKEVQNLKHAAFFEEHSNPEFYQETFNDMKTRFRVNHDKWGNIRVALVPFRDSHGRPFLFGASMRLSEVEKKLNELIVSCLFAGGIFFILSMFISWLLARSIIRPIQRLTQTIQGIMEGEKDLVADGRGTYEQAVLAHSFNQMNQVLREKVTEIEKQKEDIRITLESIGDGVIATDEKGHITRINPKAEHLTGWHAGDAIGKSLEQVFHIINSQTRERSVDPVSHVIKSGMVIGLANHTLLIAKDGTERQISDSAAPIFDAHKNIIGVVLVFSDVTHEYVMRTSLQKSEESFRGVIDLAVDGILLGDASGVIFDANAQFLTILGKSKFDIVGKHISTLFSSEELSKQPLQFEALKRGEKIIRERVIVRTDSSQRIVEMHSKMMPDQTYQTFVHDITERKQAEAFLKESKEQFRELFDNMADGVVIYQPVDNGADFIFFDMNRAAQRLSKINKKEDIGRKVTEKLPGIVAMGLLDVFRRVYSSGDAEHYPQTIYKDNNFEQWVENYVFRLPSGMIVAIYNDVTERRTLENKLLALAHYDPLTALPSRAMFFEKAGIFLAHAKQNNTPCSLLFIDIDQFKNINDELGHSIGDELIRDCGKRLTSCIGNNDIIARLGGDEFIIFTNDVNDANLAQEIAERIKNEFSASRAVGGNDVFLTVSIGIAVFPQDGDTLEDLLKDADTAMHEAKKSGRNTFCFFDPVMHQKVITRMQIERGLREAITKKEFALFYQPIVDIKNKKIRGFEALLRWFKSDGGLVFPDEFIPVAEETGLIVPIGDWVIHQACRFNKELFDAGFAEKIMAVNISVAQLRRKSLVDVIKKALFDNQLDPKYLEIEITESLLIESFDLAISILNDIRDLGVKISLDDFGTGYSSLCHLQQLPIHTLKIDRLFIKSIDQESDENDLTSAIIDLAHKLKLDVIAEGVENKIQLQRLIRHECDHYQGYLFSKPIPEEKVTQFLIEHGEKQS